MARRRGETIECYVDLNGKLDYGFRTNKDIHESYKAELGQTTYAGKIGVVFGCNSPKPSRATKEFASGSISSFCSTDKISSLKKADWVVTRKGSIRGIKTTGKTRTVYVDMPGGWKYAWNITKEEADLSGDLGFELADGGVAGDLSWGVQYPKPPRATKREAGSSTSTFIAPKASVIDAAVGKGWSISGVDYDLIP